MKITIRYLLVFVVILASFPSSLSAQSIETGGNEQESQRYLSPHVGISFVYPADRSLEAPDQKPSRDSYHITLYPSTNVSTASDKIDIAIHDFEIAEGQSLQAWAEVHYRLSLGGLPLPEVRVLRHEKDSESDGSERQILHTQIATDLGPAQTIWLTYGRLVVTFTTYTHDTAVTKVLAEIASSVEFAPDAPKTLDELYGVTAERISLEEALEIALSGYANPTTCDTACMDQEVAEKLVPGAPPPLTTEFLEAERQYNDYLRQKGELLPQSVVELANRLFLPSISQSINQVSRNDLGAVIAQGTPGENRRALPANWWAPIVSASGTTKNVDCSSSFHTGADTFAIDIGDSPTGTNVFAAKEGYVAVSVDSTTGYGKHIMIDTTVNVANGSRTYRHVYAHLNYRGVNPGSTVGRGQYIGDVGCTGNCFGTHLHFAARITNMNNDPVDLSPMVGFTPNLSYPTTGSCGKIEPRENSPLIIDPVMFTERYHPRNDHWWFCYTDLPRTGECYMHGVPNNGAGWDPIVPSQSPELRYNNVHVPVFTNYYIWVCGRGGTLDDDSLHMGYADTAYGSSDRITGYHNDVWVWKSETMDGHRPWLAMVNGERIVNVWMREDGMKIDRILLTRDSGYQPSSIRCGGY